MVTSMNKRSPGNNPHADRRNFTLGDYLQMCRDGEAEFSLSEVARIEGVSRIYLHRCMIMASVSDEEFDEVLAHLRAAGQPLTTTSVSDEIKRRTGRAKYSEEHCPHCGGVIRVRRR